MPPSHLWIIYPQIDELKLHFVRRVRKTWIPERSVAIPVTLKELIGPLLPQGFESSGGVTDQLHGNEILLLWPSELSLAGSFRLPSVSPEDRKSALESEIESLIPWNIEECQVAYFSKRRPNGWDIYGWASPRQWLESALSHFTRCGMEPRYILPESLTLLLSRNEPFDSSDTPSSGRMNLLLGRSPGRLLLLEYQDSFPIRETVLATNDPEEGSRRLDDLILSSIMMDSPEQLDMTIPAESAEPAPDPLSAQDPAGKEVEMRLAKSMAGIWNKGSFWREMPDFRNGALSFRKNQEHLLRGVRTLGVLGAILAALILTDSWLHVHALENRVKKTQEALSDLARQTLAPAPVVEPISQLTQKRNILSKQKNILSRGTDVIGILKDIAGAPAPSIPLEMVSVSIGTHSLTLTGKTASFQDVDKIRASLLSTPHIRTLSVQSARLDIDRKTVAFRMGGTHD
ncbi:MAG: hypothetical protein ACYC9S_00010 [Leptospirales bacterium]